MMSGTLMLMMNGVRWGSLSAVPTGVDDTVDPGSMRCLIGVGVVGSAWENCNGTAHTVLATPYPYRCASGAFRPMGGPTLTRRTASTSGIAANPASRYWSSLACNSR